MGKGAGAWGRTKFEDLLIAKHILVVVSGSLTSLPFQVLVTQPTDEESGSSAYQNVKWLITRQPLTVLPHIEPERAEAVCWQEQSHSPVCRFRQPHSGWRPS
jgi:hypothetical protein